MRSTARSAQAGFGLPTSEQAMRVAMAEARWDAALRVATSEKAGGPSDRLLRDLYAGTVAYYAARWDSSTAAFDRAATLADDRFTKSASRGALALATNDLALPYVPGENERLLVHYYGMLAWLRRGSLADAVVEARRLSAMLQQYDDANTLLDSPTRATLRYVAGAVFETAGEGDDAAVAYRNARLLAGIALPDSVADDSVPPPPRRVAARKSGARLPVKALTAVPVTSPPDSGDVVLVLEQGFVAHRVEQRLTVRAADGGDWRVFANGASGSDAIARAASMLTGDAMLWADSPAAEVTLPAPTEPVEPGALHVDALDVAGALGRQGGDGARRERNTTWATRLRIAWPAYRRTVQVPNAALIADSAAMPLTPLLRANLSDAAAGDFRRDRTARLARLLVRAAVREAAVGELVRKHHDLGSLARNLGNAIEHADTRSWHVLPATIAVTRIRMRAGDHSLVADVGGARIPIADVHVVRGGVAIITARLWGSTHAPIVATVDTLAHGTTSP